MFCKFVRAKDLNYEQGLVDFKCVKCGRKVSFDRTFFSAQCNDDIEICAKYAGECTKNTERVATFRDQTAPLVNSYIAALEKWTKAGKPTRSEEEVLEIFENHCKNCVFFEKNTNRCNTCGCKLSTEEATILEQLKLAGVNAMINKIRMKTEYCPVGIWGEDPLKTDEQP